MLIHLPVITQPGGNRLLDRLQALPGCRRAHLQSLEAVSAGGNPMRKLNNLISSSFVVLRPTTREQEQNFMTPAVCACGSLVRFHPVRVYVVLSPLQMGQVNPSVRLYVVTVDGSSVTSELMPPDSFEKRFVQTEQTHSSSQSLGDCLFGWLSLHLVVVFFYFSAATSTSPW